MYLKRIEMQGFKSFADKTVLEFKPGITTVIGPNGSGKSNISDAIRWVLGEQSMKSLRGAKSEDIIFAGTQARKSLGFAEVSIVIDNNDNKLPIEYSEVTVTRKIYRSGETGYFINIASPVATVTYLNRTFVIGNCLYDTPGCSVSQSYICFSSYQCFFSKLCSFFLISSGQ